MQQVQKDAQQRGDTDGAFNLLFPVACYGVAIEIPPLEKGLGFFYFSLDTPWSCHGDLYYKRFDSKTSSSATRTLTGVGAARQKIEITQLTVSVSPKVLLMAGSRFRLWVIPVGLDFHVISPPSGDVTVLDVGAQFAVGVQDRVWKAVLSELMDVSISRLEKPRPRTISVP